MIKFDRPNDFSYNADLNSIANGLVQVMDALEKLMEDKAPTKKAPKKVK